MLLTADAGEHVQDGPAGQDPRPWSGARQAPEERSRPGTTGTERPRSDTQVMRVLVVDDEEDIRVLLRAQLERSGYDVTGEAADGIEAIELCDADCPDAVILDLLMPRMNGFEVIPKLRSKYPDMAIIAYTAVAGDFVRNEMKRLRIPLVLKSGQFNRLDAVLRDLRPLG